MAFNNEIEKTKKEIEVLTKKLSLLEQIEKHKTPCEIAYKDWWGEYPGDENWTSDATRWQGFQAGYNAADTQKAQERGERVHNEMEETIKIHDGYGVVNYQPTPQTPEQVADGLKEAFREAVKQGVVSSTKRQTLTDLIYDWWEDVFTTHSDWDMETCIDDLVDNIDYWLPKEHDTNDYKWNACIRMIREKLR